ncbi:hypothetical protein EDC14_101451 [Hydrogenispora ethanolica]|uniref:Nitroimidazol reductase NimA-like FMN-containing flavoprotein (Pyridoxamine 5'-phosphate oxidase superfamily) n=1 Tax=Hydrogenispora ethanolica TaxID=1082276 RepID=A0A4R1RNE9_HYDET|nr:pyridoxamine 5'-phosphate oxidase family protein [Hydrogenispora ethanolica]TCL67362.1 hypothetical protein EDC14_101451 [Hydrogenispora ethanolica]
MPQKQLTQEEAIAFLAGETLGHLATVDAGGAPYITPLHYLYHEGVLYFHCAATGRKLENIAANPRVCFAVDRIDKAVFRENACQCSTRYTSVLVFGTAELVTEVPRKAALLQIFTEKLAGGRSFPPIPAAAAAACTVVAIRIEAVHGKRNVDPEPPQP